MAGCRITPVLVFWTGRAVYWVKFTSETDFELPSSWVDLPCYGSWKLGFVIGSCNVLIVASL